MTSGTISPESSTPEGATDLRGPVSLDQLKQALASLAVRFDVIEHQSGGSFGEGDAEIKKLQIRQNIEQLQSLTEGASMLEDLPPDWRKMLTILNTQIAVLDVSHPPKV